MLHLVCKSNGSTPNSFWQSKTSRYNPLLISLKFLPVSHLITLSSNGLIPTNPHAFKTSNIKASPHPLHSSFHQSLSPLSITIKSLSNSAKLSKNCAEHSTNFKPMGLSMNNPSYSATQSHHRTHKIFLLCNYILLGAASSCIFLTLSLRLLPSVCGLLLIFLHILTIFGAVSGCTAVSAGTNRWYGAHMVVTVITAIFQGSVSVLIFASTTDFLHRLKSYVREEDGAVILKLAGGLCIAIFCLEWVVLGLAFVLRYNEFVEGNGNGGAVALGGRGGKVHQEEDVSNWPWPFQV